MKLNKKMIGIVALSSVLISGTLLTNDVFAANATKTLKAVYSNIKLVYNGQTISSSSGQEPFMVNGTTYVPIRMAGEALGKSLVWDGTNKIVNISDTSSSDAQVIEMLRNQITDLNNQLNSAKTELTTANSTIASKDSTITSLQSEINSLKKDNKSGSLSSLEDDLDDDHENDYDLDASFSLSGDKDDISVTIKVDEKTWNNLSSSRQKTFLQDIADDIRREFKDAKIDGTVKNKNSSKLTTFSVSRSGTLSIGSSSSNVPSQSTMLSQLKRDYSTYRGIPLSIQLEVDKDREEVTVEVYIVKRDWDDLSSSYQTKLLSNMLTDLDREYPDYDIEGYVYDDNTKSRLDRQTR
ncbi:stalk domain-containing protein [Paenibacillus macerans]|uniref:stalk domain-containing protein n=1 Tax=Paenibacillus macerans TaxID=44252 RepID=UPI002041BF70|nr:stalk domain-containing protein [Paenibacillus macerans]MCM3702994.1 copper amine oxidase N-terminal domain-containing protein [Paenibacillus macerans]